MKLLLMKTKLTSWVRVVLAIAGVLVLALTTVSCKKQAATKPPDVDYYTCTMHPSVKSQDPNAKCPICSMSLVPVRKRQSVGASERESVGKAPALHAPDAPRSDAKSMGMSEEEHAKMSGGKEKQEMKGMKGM